MLTDWTNYFLANAPTGANIVTLDEVKVHCRVSHGDDDTYLKNLIAEAEDAISGPRGVGVVVRPSQWTLTFPSFASGGFSIGLGPVTSVESVTYRDINNVVHTVDPSIYHVDLKQRPARIVLNFGCLWPTDMLGSGNPVEVNFTAGFVTPPPALKTAMRLLVSHYYDERSPVVGTRGSAAPTEMPWSISNILNQFRTY